MFRPVEIYDMDGDFVGFAILGEKLLQSTNVWAEGEWVDLEARVNELNESEALKAVWPTPADPDVLAILQDHSFMPIEYEVYEVIDYEKSQVVYQDNESDDNVFGWGAIDYDKSTIVYKTVESPVDASEAALRRQEAMKLVAQRRLQNTLH